MRRRRPTLKPVLIDSTGRATAELDLLLANTGGSGGATNLSYSAGATTVTVASDTGTDAVIAAATGASAGVLTASDKSKLDGVASGATANSSDATLLNRANHTGTQAASTISDFSEAVDDRVNALLVAGANVTLTYDDPSNTLTIAASGGGGGSLSTILTVSSLRV